MNIVLELAGGVLLIVAFFLVIYGIMDIIILWNESPKD